MSRTVIDVNCDMGEAFGTWSLGDTEDAALIPFISSANVAAGFRASDPNLMDRTIQLAAKAGVRVRVGALDPQRIADTVIRACVDGKVRTVEGDDIEFDSMCFHSNTPGALAIAQALKAAYAANGIRVVPAASLPTH